MMLGQSWGTVGCWRTFVTDDLGFNVFAEKASDEADLWPGAT